MSKIALFHGTFDPFTNGHAEVVAKGLNLFDRIYIAIGINASKKEMFSLQQRIEWIQAVYKNIEQVKVISYSGLTLQICEEVGAKFILRGLRTVSDFEYERQIALVNESLNPHLQSIFVMSGQEHSIISSTIIRDLIRHGGEFRQYLPVEVAIPAKPV
jgi:pantetheine-phosphate adenylyltransferase